jgi:hypothetical protein
MGCHTSFYEKSEIQLPRLTKKVKKQIINFLYKRNKKQVILSYYKYTAWFLNQPVHYKKYQRIKRFKQAFDYSNYVMQLRDWCRITTIWFIEGIIGTSANRHQYSKSEKLLLKCSRYDIFRVWDYPNDVLKSYQDYLDFKKKYATDDIWFCESEQECDEIVKEFFDDGGYLIEFG